MEHHSNISAWDNATTKRGQCGGCLTCKEDSRKRRRRTLPYFEKIESMHADAAKLVDFLIVALTGYIAVET